MAKDKEKSDKKNSRAESESKKPLTKEEEDYKTQMQRVQAEFENYRRRTDDEKSNLKQFYVSSVIQKIIPILDHFELALKHECSDKNYSMGVEMIFNQFKQVLDSEGVSEINLDNKKFDSTLAEVVSTKFDESKDDDSILEVQMKGYQMGDKVIRRARVVVNKKPVDAQEESK